MKYDFHSVQNMLHSSHICTHKFIYLMLYNILKFLHILSATLLLISIVYCCRIWLSTKSINETMAISQQIQSQTWLIIIPFALFQLATGFTMINLKHYDSSEFWIIGSIIGFIILIGSWFSFIYFLLSSQQSTKHFKFFRRTQFVMLLMCSLTLLCMIFLMANRVN